VSLSKAVLGGILTERVKAWLSEWRNAKNSRARCVFDSMDEWVSLHFLRNMFMPCQRASKLYSN